MENILFGLIPALMWGAQPIIMTKLGGKSNQKVMGMALGIFVTSIIISIFNFPKDMTFRILLFSFFDGIALSYGLINQIKGLSLLGVSKGTPISTGTQLIGATLVGAIYFKEWTNINQYIVGIAALFLIIIGVSMTAFQEETVKNSVNVNVKKGIITLILSSLGFVIYTIIPRVANISIWDALIPQGLGMLLGSYLLSKLEFNEKLFTTTTFKHMLTGFIFAIGNITLMISNVVNGLALGFTLTQMNVVIATLSGLLILKEPKTKKELKYTIIGLIFVVIGGILIGITKK